MDRIEEYHKQQSEGYVFLHFFSMVAFGDVSFYKNYYTVLNGIIYLLNKGEKVIDKSTFEELVTTSKKLGKYSPNDTYESNTVNMSLERAITLLNI